MSSKKGLLEQIINSDLAGKLGVPQGEKLRRYKEGEPALDGPVVLGGEGRVAAGVREFLDADFQFVDADTDIKKSAIIFDATGITTPEDIKKLYDFFHPQMRKVRPCARFLVIGTTPEAIEDADERIVQRAIEGFVRSLAKELLRGATAQLIYVDPAVSDDLSGLEAPVRFVLSGKSAYVDGQVIRVDATHVETPESWATPTAGKVALVTGAARGIGADIARVLARDGAKVIIVDVPAAGEALAEITNEVKGSALPLDVTAPDAADKIKAHAEEKWGQGVDIIVHNAGVTRDKLLANMDEGKWNLVQAINFIAPIRITEALLENGGLNEGGRVITLSSMDGLAGQRGQTNYAMSKAGMIGIAEALAPQVAAKGITVNAIAPGFIETAMTAEIPTGTREVGRRLNSLSQGGLPLDVAEGVGFFAGNASGAVTGQYLRVCGQHLMGA
ncbi:3-oxoacyl-ACP reductase [Corynebacterium terpenotabidum]|uniref:3-oxoacyl-[acyl-carrier-protein] reductase MabA n=1 Tax=Corynebacterium terpenotabidum Y-11 TaxID=1200352 RepID=S4XG68_9CORY|nr:3-oxoacyl-ACP reductase [Corynebacterium terpenotabidum]AGP30650.1 3-ketoacyl-(acyl-carrier-protein) reductase [Corynebacterium terpenotabidum Y-11]